MQFKTPLCLHRMADKVAKTVTKKNKSAVHDPTNICLRIHSLDGEDIAILRFTNCSTYFPLIILRYTSLMMKGIRLSALETDVLCPQKWYLRRHNTSFHTGLSEYSQSFSDGLPFTVRKYIGLYADSISSSN